MFGGTMIGIASYRTTTSSLALVKRGRSLAPAIAQRALSVKELSWCAPSDSPTRQRGASSRRRNAEEDRMYPIDRFGIVAASSSKEGIIGVNGKLPWRIPEDRSAFVDLTSEKILVIGRRTLREQADLGHISHAARCVVLSRSMTADDVDGPGIVLAQSFREALHVARELASDLGMDRDDPGGIHCWVAGGERLYQEALLHPSAERLHLTVVDAEVDAETVASARQVARFPAKYRWDSNFKECSREEHVSENGGIRFTKVVYNRLKDRF